MLDAQRMDRQGGVRSAQRLREPPLVRCARRGAIMCGPSTKVFVGHYLTEAIRHLYAAAEFAREPVSWQ